MDALGKFREHSRQEARVALGYHLEQLLRFFCALQTSRVHPQLYIRTLSMNQFFNVHVEQFTKYAEYMYIQYVPLPLASSRCSISWECSPKNSTRKKNKKIKNKKAQREEGSSHRSFLFLHAPFFVLRSPD